MAGVFSTPFKYTHVLSRTITRLNATPASSSLLHHHTLSSSRSRTPAGPLSHPLAIDAAERFLKVLSRHPAQFAAIIRDFKTRSTTGIGKTASIANEGEPKNFVDEILFGDRKTAHSPSSAAEPSSSTENDQSDITSALSQKRKSISRLLKKYKKQPEVQQQLKIAFADGYSYAEQKTSSEGDKKSGAASYLSYASDLIWWCIGLWVMFHVLSELRHSFSGGEGFSRNLFNSLGPYEVNPEDIAITFNDVKGVDEAKDELLDVVEFLRDPDRFSSLGGKMPHGVLLVGEPGVGKTLLAKAVAGEAGVPFFHASGSEFDEVFVGTGAKRVRQLFTSAKERAPAVIFIDEIDSVGGKRTSSPGHPYANQTINMLLSEMDGFEKNEGVIVIGATNKRDNLDKALIRPGRFDVEVTVYPPDVKARKELFDLYVTKVFCDDEVDTMQLAKDTRGFVGADIDNMVNQAAIRAGKQNANAVSMEHLNWARDKVSMGPEKKSKIPDEKVNWNTAVHEAGHATVAYHTAAALPLRKATIMPRGPALGYVEQTPKDVMTNDTKAEMLAQVDVCMGGKVAEELEQGSLDVTPGCSSDLDKATALAQSMVHHYGMSEKLGFRTIHTQEDYEELSNATKTLIDEEIRSITDAAYERAEAILKKYKTEHLALAKALMKYETLDAADLDTIFKGKPLFKKGFDDAGVDSKNPEAEEEKLGGPMLS